MPRLSLSLFRAFKTSLLVRNVDGHYSMINGQDQWDIAATSTVKFAPSLVISPSRTVRILGQQSKSDETTDSTTGHSYGSSRGVPFNRTLVLSEP